MNPVATIWARIKSNERLHVAWCVFGIVGCLMLYGVLQERIMVEPYISGNKTETFKYSLFLVLCNRLTSCAVAIVSLLVRRKRERSFRSVNMDPHAERRQGVGDEARRAHIHLHGRVAQQRHRHDVPVRGLEVSATPPAHFGCSCYPCAPMVRRYVSFPVQTLVRRGYPVCLN